MQKDKSGNYECPDVFDIADGAMWNNKMNNIIVYHRPFAQIDTTNPLAEVHFKKIKKKSVGKRGFTTIEYIWNTRRFFVQGRDITQDILNKKNYDFWNGWKGKQAKLDLPSNWDNQGVIDDVSQIDF
jgi:hypothetical protein